MEHRINRVLFREASKSVTMTRQRKLRTVTEQQRKQERQAQKPSNLKKNMACGLETCLSRPQRMLSVIFSRIAVRSLAWNVALVRTEQRTKGELLIHTVYLMKVNSLGTNLVIDLHIFSFRNLKQLQRRSSCQNKNWMEDRCWWRTQTILNEKMALPAKKS